MMRLMYYKKSYKSDGIRHFKYDANDRHIATIVFNNARPLEYSASIRDFDYGWSFFSSFELADKFICDKLEEFGYKQLPEKLEILI
jgi:hypothetical protein